MEASTEKKRVSGPEGLRTLDLTVKSRLLYLAKLRAHWLGTGVHSYFAFKDYLYGKNRTPFGRY